MKLSEDQFSLLARYVHAAIDVAVEKAAYNAREHSYDDMGSFWREEALRKVEQELRAALVDPDEQSLPST